MTPRLGSMFALAVALPAVLPLGGCRHAPRTEAARRPSTVVAAPCLLDESALRLTMESVRPQLLGCCPPIVRSARPPQNESPVGNRAGGWSAIGLEIAADGEVRRSTASGGDGTVLELGCMENVARLVRFPASPSASTYATYWVRCEL